MLMSAQLEKIFIDQISSRIDLVCLEEEKKEVFFMIM